MLFSVFIIFLSVTVQNLSLLHIKNSKKIFLIFHFLRLLYFSLSARVLKSLFLLQPLHFFHASPKISLASFWDSSFPRFSGLVLFLLTQSFRSLKFSELLSI